MFPKKVEVFLQEYEITSALEMASFFCDNEICEMAF